MSKDLNHLIKQLLENGVEFVLVGGYASMIHGSNYITQDVDICAVITDDQVEKIRKSVQGLHAVHRDNKKVTFQDRPLPGEKLQNIYLLTDAGPLDVLSSVAGVGDFPALKTNAVPFPLFGHQCLVMSLDDLIKSKQAMNRDKDKAMLRDLIELRDIKSRKE